MAVCDGGRACDGVAVISDTTAATHRRQSEAAHAWCVMVAVRVEFRGSEDLARPPANPADARRQRMAVAVVQKLGVQKAQQAEKVLTSSKTGIVLVFCSADVGSPFALFHRGAEKAGTGIRGSPRTGRGRKNSPPLRRLMKTRSRGGGGGRDGSGLSAPAKCPG